MKREDLERWWADPKNWRFPGLYQCAEDPRLIVPKRVRWAGWTINAAHSASWLVLLASAVPLYVAVACLAATGGLTVPSMLAMIAAYTILLCCYCRWESTRPRQDFQ